MTLISSWNLLYFPSFWLSRVERSQTLGDIQFLFLKYFIIMDAKEYDVVIVGAGMAGLSAARNLIDHGITNILIIEANDRIGGRLYTIPLKGNDSGNFLEKYWR
jgi:NADPH-dependent 2,4-dienoyl-CoA reductase/sulfur reductase-like enzyme